MTKKIHLIAACGTGMGTLACILKEMGYAVSGSDANVYPPMSDFLIQNGIELFQGYNETHLAHNPDLVIIGNAVTKDNPEASAALDRGFEYLSMPQAVNRFVAADKKIILITGTHGKTTTSSMMAHMLSVAGLDPSFMIGGILRDYNSSFKIGRGEYMVIEGDEYDTAFFDKGPKFMHYDPYITVITGIEFDHADIFKDIGHIKQVFSALIEKIKKTSHIIAYDASDHLNAVLSQFDIAVQTYGRTGDWSFTDHEREQNTTLFEVSGPKVRVPVRTKMVGTHNIFNALSCVAAADRLGIPTEKVQQAFSSFSGVKRRQEMRGVINGITVMDDFAHHPTAVLETIRAVKPFYSNGRVIAVFEPRTNTSMRRFFQDKYPDSFADADLVYICEPGVKKNIPADEKFNTQKLVRDIEKKGVRAVYCENTKKLLSIITGDLVPNDLVLIMSNGGFDNIHARLLEKLK